MLTTQQKTRYSRHIFLPDINEQGQEKLLAATVLIIGLGGLGSAAAFYLASSGIGTLYLSDNEHIELSNLQRQILYTTDDIGQLKTHAAKKHLQALNPEINMIPLPGLQANKLSKEFSTAIETADVILDCSDNFATRYAVNKFCVHYKKPLVSGSASAWQGQIATFRLDQPQHACYACLFPEQNSTVDQQPRCTETGIVSPVVGIIGSMQALTAIKLILNDFFKNTLQCFDGKTGEWTHHDIPIDPLCKVCRPS